MVKLFPGAPAVAWWPAIANTSAQGTALPVRRMFVTVVSAFFIVGAAAWALAQVNAAVGEQVARRVVAEPVAFQPSQFVRMELSAGYIGR